MADHGVVTPMNQSQPNQARMDIEIVDRKYSSWAEITQYDLEKVRETTKSVSIGNVELSLHPDQFTDLSPESYENERTTVWSFPDRGDWATHKGNYRGNWSPYIPRNLLLKFTEPGDIVLDQMCGSGTTLIESKLLGRHCIGVDINEDAAVLSRSRLDFELSLDHWSDQDLEMPTIRTFTGDARDLSPVPDESIDLVATHPPYANIINYTRKETDADISAYAFPEFLDAMGTIAAEAYRVLKPGKYCGILMGDTRKKKHYVPVSVGVLTKFLEAGFILKEDVIKVQHNMKGTRERWRGTYDFQLIAHEHLFILRKPETDESVQSLKWSQGWWTESAE